MFARFDVSLTKDDYIGGLTRLMEQLGRQDPHGDYRIFEQLGVVTVLILVLTFVFRDAAWGIFVAIVALSFAQSALGSRWVRKGTGASYDPATADCTVEFSETEIVDRCGGRTRRWAWSAVREVHDTGSALVLELSGWDMLILPNRLWEDEAQRQSFLLQARALIRRDRAEQAPAPDQFEAPQATRELLLLGAIAAAVDAAFFLAIPVIEMFQRGSTAGVIVGLALIGSGIYFGYRLARYLLGGMYAASPVLTKAIAYALIGMLPAYMAASYLGWL